MNKILLFGLFAVLSLFTTACGNEALTNIQENQKPVVENQNKVEEPSETVAVVEEKKEPVEEVVEEPTKSEEQKEPAKSDENTKENTRAGPSGKLEGMEVHFIDVGQADATLLKYSHEGEEYRMLIDAGNWNSSNVVNYLSAQGVSNIDILVGTHPDADHIGQIDKIINQFDVDEVWLSGNTSNSQVFNRMLDAIESKDVGYHEPRAGEVYDIGPLVVDVLNPTGTTGDVQDESISLRIAYGDVSFLFTGDAEEEGERNMLSSGQNLQADIFQMGHHGSKTSNTQAFLDKVNPKVAIISAGADNQYGHPHDEVVNRVKSKGIDLYATPVNGTVIVKTDGKTYKVTTKKDGNVTPNGKSAAAVVVKAQPSKPVTTEKPKETPSANCIDINKASLDQIQEIIHFGPARAEELIQLRPFSSVDDLDRVNGIAAARLNDIKSQGLACVGG